MPATNDGMLGSVSHGTLRPVDLLAAFASEVRRRVGECDMELVTVAEAEEMAQDLESHDDAGYGHEAAHELVNELIDILDSLAPPFCYFGTLEGDGSDFGFWFDHDRFEEARRDGELPCFTDLADLDGLDEKEKPVGDFAVINDHGNVELFARHPDGMVEHLVGLV